MHKITSILASSALVMALGVVTATAANPKPKYVRPVNVERVAGGFRAFWSPVTVANYPADSLKPGDVTYLVRLVKDFKCLDTLEKNKVDTSITYLVEPREGLNRFRFMVNSFFQNKYDDGYTKLATSTMGMSAEVGVGWLTTPFERHFWDTDNAKVFDDFACGSVVDANADKATWATFKSTALSPLTNKTFDVMGMNKTNQRDDWYFTPGIMVKKGHCYAYSVELNVSDATKPEGLTVMAGAAPDVASMTLTVIPTWQCASTTPVTYSGTFVAPIDGLYYIGMHALSDDVAGKFYINGHAIDAGYLDGTPGVVGNVSAVSDYEGTNKVTISFTAPTTEVNGSALTDLTGIDLLRDGLKVHTFATTTPGEALTYVDEPDENGYHAYTLVPSNTKGSGKITEFKAYAGVNTPGESSFVAAKTVSDTEARVTWLPVDTDIDGSAVKASNVTYNVYFQDTENTTLVASGLSETAVTVAVAKPGVQRVGRFYVAAVTAAGEGAKARGIENVAVGPTMAMPWGESFRMGGYEGNFGWERDGLLNTIGRANNTPTDCQDQDNGAIWIGTEAADKEHIQGISTPRLHIAGERPVARFYVLGDPTCKHPLGVEVNTGEGWYTIFTCDYDTIPGDKDTWCPVEVPLDHYKGQDVRVRMSVLNNQYRITSYDNFMVCNLGPDSTSVNLGVQRIYLAADEADAGQRIPVYVQVRNYSKVNVAAADWSVTLTRDGKTVATLPGTDLLPFRANIFTFLDSIPAVATGTVTYEATITSSVDTRTEDNIRTLTADVRASNVPAVATLQGDNVHKVARLTWTAPSLEGAQGETRTETFEDFDPWIWEGVGQWTMVDADGYKTCGYVPNKCAEVDFKVLPWYVFDTKVIGRPDKIITTYPAFMGERGLASRCTVEGSNTQTPIDDWAILPRLSGHAQTISFYATGREMVQLWASTTGKELSDFSLLEACPHGIHPCGYNRVSVSVPEGTTYVAIRHHNGDKPGDDCARVDNVRYTPALNADIAGYRVYCDGECVSGSAPLNVMAYDYEPAEEGNHSFYVTTVMSDGTESSPSNIVTLATSGIDTIAVDGHREVARYNVAGQQVDSAYRGTVIVRYSDGTAQRLMAH